MFHHLKLLNGIRVVVAGKGGEGVDIGLANIGLPLPRQGAADFVEISLITHHVCTL